MHLGLYVREPRWGCFFFYYYIETMKTFSRTIYAMRYSKGYSKQHFYSHRQEMAPKFFPWVLIMNAMCFQETFNWWVLHTGHIYHSWVVNSDSYLCCFSVWIILPHLVLGNIDGQALWFLWRQLRSVNMSSHLVVVHTINNPVQRLT